MDINSITPLIIDSLAVNASAISAAKGVAKSKLALRNISADNSLIFGECSGSGKSNYGCSFDLISDTARCTCPSRQIPCKHVLGLLYAYTDDKNSFEVAEIPDDIAKKRERAEKRLEAKENPPAKKSKPVSDEKRAKTAAKRIAVQLEGLEIAEKLLGEIVKLGFVAIDSKAVREYRFRAKELGNYYINGVLIRFNELLDAITIAQNNTTDEHIKAAILLYQLISQGRNFLNEKLKNPLEIRTDTDLEEQLGFVWKTEKLIEAGLTLENLELAELYYIRDLDSVRQEWVTEASFINLKDGVIYRRLGFFPNKRNLKITEDYSYDILSIPQAAVYPGVINRRIRFASDNVKTTAFSPHNAKRIKEFAEKDFSAAVKNAKNILRNPLQSQHVIALLEVDDIFETEDKQSVITDKNGFKIGLSENAFSYRSADSWLDKSRFINLLSKDFIAQNTLCVSLEYSLSQGTLYAAPLSIITDKEIIRLL
jgi:hypothetical protein